MKILIIGAGSIGRRHAQILHNFGHEIDCYDVETDPVERLARSVGGDAYTSLPRALDTRPGAVFVCSPSAFHIEHAIASLKYNCHVFIEKPLATSLDGTQELLSLAKERKRLVMCGFNLRYDKGLQAVKDALENEKIGKIVSILSVAGQYLPDQRPGTDYRKGYGAQKALGGGVILDGIHEIDYQTWLIGDVGSLSCLADKRSSLEIDTEDNASLLLEYRSGVKGMIQMDYVKRVYQRFCHIIGTEGTITWDFTTGETKIYSAKEKSWVILRDDVDDWRGMVDQLYIDEVQDFIDRIQANRFDTRMVESAIAVLRVALRSKESASQGGALLSV